ncbi:carboxymuconolactone decarboxylase family protein [Reyranella sp.]|jgi:AhpD family alkylhydroperoxidase|uniref:carboxymuconolactone decarboxylase family protein n=1 Tax=Reyranella sp. TaxID=1929291 RepID=UPI002F954BCC
MKARMNNPVMVIPEALQALLAVGQAAKKGGLPPQTALLVHLRASQINGCGVCVDMHSRELRKAGAPDERIFGVAAWRESPYFTDPERAALALTEAATRLADRADAVPDDIWGAAAGHFDERALAALLIEIALINAWNRLNAASRQPAGSVPV